MRRSFEQSDDGGPRGVVEVDNPGARRLYERLGYADWGHGTIVGTWVDRDRAGPAVRVSEQLHMLVKPLSGHGPG